MRKWGDAMRNMDDAMSIKGGAIRNWDVAMRNWRDVMSIKGGAMKK